MAVLIIEIDKIKDLPALQDLLNQLGVSYVIKADETSDLVPGKNIKESETPPYKLLSEEDSKQNLLDFAAPFFKEGWTSDDKEEDEYWNSFLK